MRDPDRSQESKVVYIDDARRRRLVPDAEPEELSWTDLLERMHHELQPLTDAGWQLSGDERDNDCVVCFLTRGENWLSVDHYPDGWTHFWITDAAGRSDEELPTAEVPPGDTIESVAHYYEWI